VTRITQIRKRDGRLVPFEPRRVADAIYRAAQSVGGEDRFLAEELAGVVGLYLERSHGGRIPGIADVEDAVERVLVDTGHARTAKAYILHRDRRRAARERVHVLEDDPVDRPLPVVGSEGTGAVSAWSKARIVRALLEEAALDEPTAEEVARAVEGRVLSSGVPRISSSLVRALVDSELFARGRTASRDRQRVVGVPKRDLARRLAEGVPDRRAADPASLSEALGEEVLRPYVLEEVVPPGAAEAHRQGDLHLHDLGAPLALAHVALGMEALLARSLRGEGASRSSGARRMASALSEAVVRHGASAARTFALEDVNVHLAPLVDRLDEDALHAEMRELLLSPAFTLYPRRGGLLRLELVLGAEVPTRLQSRPAPAPAPPGRLLGDQADDALRVARAILAAASELRREGAGDRLPTLTLTVPRAASRDPAARALLRDALAGAAEAGEPRFLFDAPGLPSRGGRALRVRAEDATDPLRFESGDVSIATVAAVNLVGAALRCGAGREDAFLHELRRLVRLALDAASARVGFLTRRGEARDGGLWTLRSGADPLVDLEGAFHAVEVVGADRAATLLAPEASATRREAIAAAAWAHVVTVAAAEGRERSLSVVVTAPSNEEACVRFAAVDAARFERAARWWPDREVASYADTRPSGPAALFEAVGSDRTHPAGIARRLVRRFDPEKRPPLDDLLATLEQGAADPSVVELALDPWPRRWLRSAP